MLRFTVCFHIFSNKRPLVNNSILQKLSDCTICQGFNFTFSVKGVGGEDICLAKSRVDYVALKLKSKRLGFTLKCAQD